MHCTTLMRQLKFNNSLNKRVYKQSPPAKIFSFSLPLKLTLRCTFLTKTSNFRF